MEAGCEASAGGPWEPRVLLVWGDILETLDYGGAGSSCVCFRDGFVLGKQTFSGVQNWAAWLGLL